MPRAPIILQNEYPYSVTARCNNKDWFQLPLPDCWKIFEKCIEKTSEMYGFETHQFVMMSNHYHWLLSTPNRNLDKGMRYFMTEASRMIARQTGRINKIFGARYKWCLINRPSYYALTYRYIYQNPLRAEICKHLSEYPYSSYDFRSKIKLVERVDLNEFVPKQASDLDAWLHQLPHSKANDLIRKGLRRFRFEFSERAQTENFLKLF